MEIKLDKNIYNFTLKAKNDLFCADCGNNNFIFQCNQEGEAELFATGTESNIVALGVTCKNCGLGYSMQLQI
jgi:hypothetical protein